MQSYQVLGDAGGRATRFTRFAGKLAAAVTLSASAPAGGLTFQDLGFLTDGVLSRAHGVSGEGAVVTGQATAPGTTHAFRWTAGGGMLSLGDLPGGAFYSSANAISANGTTIVGQSASADGVEAFRWTAGGGMAGLGDLPGGEFASEALAASANGSVVVGWGSSAAGREAYRWTAGGGMVGLGALPGGEFLSEATGVSADGSVVVGSSSSVDGGRAFRWTAGGGMVSLGVLPGGEDYSQASGVSADGQAVVGVSGSELGDQAFRWTEATGMMGLDHSGEWLSSYATGVSADGSVIVGFGDRAGSGEIPFIWNATDGLQSIQDLLSGSGIDLTGWILTRANAISADGLTVAGEGFNPSGQREGWIARIPEPATLLLLAVAGMSLLRRQ